MRFISFNPWGSDLRFADLQTGSDISPFDTYVILDGVDDNLMLVEYEYQNWAIFNRWEGPGLFVKLPTSESQPLKLETDCPHTAMRWAEKEVKRLRELWAQRAQAQSVCVG